jgi:hypothetical protein
MDLLKFKEGELIQRKIELLEDKKIFLQKALNVDQQGVRKYTVEVKFFMSNSTAPMQDNYVERFRCYDTINDEAENQEIFDLLDKQIERLKKQFEKL